MTTLAPSKKTKFAIQIYLKARAYLGSIHMCPAAINT